MVVFGQFDAELPVEDVGVVPGGEVVVGPSCRGGEDGFWLVVRGPVEGPGQRARWHVAFDGSATNEGDYPSLPINVKEPSFGKLDGAGRLIESASYEATDGLGSAIVRRSLDGDSEILNRSKSAFFGLVTGP